LPAPLMVPPSVRFAWVASSVAVNVEATVMPLASMRAPPPLAVARLALPVKFSALLPSAVSWVETRRMPRAMSVPPL